MRLLNPFRLARNLANLHAIATGGGPRSVHLVRVGEPEGLIVPSSEVIVDVETRDGTKVRVEPEVPMPFMIGWGIRLARKLGVPVISAVKPEDLSFSVGSRS